MRHERRRTLTKRQTRNSQPRRRTSQGRATRWRIRRQTSSAVPGASAQWPAARLEAREVNCQRYGSGPETLTHLRAYANRFPTRVSGAQSGGIRMTENNHSRSDDPIGGWTYALSPDNVKLVYFLILASLVARHHRALGLFFASEPGKVRRMGRKPITPTRSALFLLGFSTGIHSAFSCPRLCLNRLFILMIAVGLSGSFICSVVGLQRVANP